MEYFCSWNFVLSWFSPTPGFSYINLLQISPIYKYWKVSEFSPCCYCCLIAKSCLTHCSHMNCKGSSVHGISQARILEWVVVSFFRGYSWPKDWNHISCLAGRFFTTEPPGKPSVLRLTHFFIYPNSLVHLIQSPDLKCPILFPGLTFSLILVLYIQRLTQHLHMNVWQVSKYQIKLLLPYLLFLSPPIFISVNCHSFFKFASQKI